MKKQLLELKKTIVMLSLAATTASAFIDEDGIDHLQRSLMVGEISQEQYDFYNQQRMFNVGLISVEDNNFYNEKWSDGIDPFIRLQMVGEDPNYNYDSKSYVK